MKKIGIGVIGAGRWGPNLIRNFDSNPKSKVIAVADQSTNRLKLLEGRYPDVMVTEDSARILSDPNIDAVVICTPTDTHYELTLKALKNKKHVFVEKPLARTSEQCRTLIQAAKENDRLLFVGHVFVYNAGIQAVRNYIAKGDLGKIHYLQITRTNLGPVRSDVSALWDLAPHDLSILQYWFSEMPTKVSAVGGRFLNQRLEDVAFATYSFSNGIIANVHVSWLNPKKVREIVIVGEEKMLVWDDMDLNSPIRIYDKRVLVDKSESTIADTYITFRSSIHEGDTIIPKIALNEPLSAECNAFLAAIENPSTSLSTGEQGALVVDALVATDESMRNLGKEVQIQYTRV